MPAHLRPLFPEIWSLGVDMQDMIDFSTPLAGMERAESSVNQTAARIAKSSFSGSDSVDLSTEMVALMQAQNDFKGDAKVVQTEDDMNKSLLSITG
jgi:flagellar hook protein FlgE